jgi:ferrous iron transport protein B
MAVIEDGFSMATAWLSERLPAGLFTDLLLNGVMAGLSGVVVFVPQIALLFAFIAILEDSGYMARVSFLMDRLLRPVGLNGRSIIPLISGVACAVPAIMGTRTIANWKERTITLLVTPLMSCSARLPVYTLLISLMIPPGKMVWGVLSMQGLLLMALYMLGFVAALGAALVLKLILKTREKSYFIMELPLYRAPRWRNVGLTIIEKVKVFLHDAGKVILAIAIVLWALSRFGPSERRQNLEQQMAAELRAHPTDSLSIVGQYESLRLETSYAGILGKAIEPAIRPLGFDWKMGISLITSFAAREVFVGTMATLYSVGDAEDTRSIREKMQEARNPVTLKPVYSPAVCFSLILFYAFALQCMSTLAVVKRETGSWKWPLVQFLGMGALAWLASFCCFQLWP